jgi:hypothetical protein
LYKMPQKAPARKSSKSKKTTSKSKQQGFLQRVFARKSAQIIAVVAAFVVIGATTLFVVSAATTSYSFWSSSNVPKVLAVRDATSVELGLKFKSSVAGYVTGVKFYKSAQNTGTHTGSLWDTTGKQLATVTFKNETASGWQSATFDAPVSIAANVTYVVSYHAPRGYYSADETYFRNSSYTVKELTAPQSKRGNGNGVFLYSKKTSAYPSKSSTGYNYWVDVVFNTKLINAEPAPAAPTGLVASGQANGSVVLNWQASVSQNPIANYTVYRDGSKIATVGTAATYTDGTSQNGKSYMYQVQATDNTGQASVLSTSANVTVPDAPVTSDGGSGGTTTPPTTPPTTANCIGTANHVAGGADGTGTCWPGPNNTGVPAGTTLSNYTGPCVVTADNTVIDSKNINCSPLEIQAKSVTVKNSKVNGQVYINSDNPATSYNLNWSLILTDSEVNAPLVEEPAVFEGAMTIVRANIHGGITSVQCGDKSAQCIIQDSWLHGQLMPANVDWHLGGFHSIGGTNYSMVHNSVVCDTPVNNVGGGCSGDIVFIPYDKNISHALVQHNLLGANLYGSYCTYGGDKPSYAATYMVYKDNVFQRGSNNLCGAYGPVTGFNVSNIGNQWSNNTWANGGEVPPEN